MSKIVVSPEKITDEKVAAYLGQFVDYPLDKAARLLSKSYTKDRQLNNFVKASEENFTKGFRFFVDGSFAEKVKSEVMAGSIGMTSKEEKSALALHIAQKGIENAVDEKRVSLTRGLTLDDEQKETLASALIKYQQFLVTKLMPSVHKMLVTDLGVAEYEEAAKATA